MRITELRLGALSIPLKKPFKTALRSTDTVTTNIVALVSDTGAVGYGEAPPTAAITGDTDGSITCILTTRIAPALIGRDVSELQDAVSAVAHSAVGNTSAKAAADIALHDLWGKLCGQPLYRLWGGTKRTFTTDYTISLNTPEEMARDAAEAVRDGYDALKIKVGIDFRLDMERIGAVRRAVGPEVLLRVDANQGWTPKEAIRAIRYMEDEGLDIELGLISLRAADMLNIKLMKSGGLSGALTICGMAESAGMECMIGAMMESKVSVTAAAHLAMARRVVTKYDLDPPILCASDPVRGGVIYDGAVLGLNDAPGLGIDSVEGIAWGEIVRG